MGSADGACCVRDGSAYFTVVLDKYNRTANSVYKVNPKTYASKTIELQGRIEPQNILPYKDKLIITHFSGSNDFGNTISVLDKNDYETFHSLDDSALVSAIYKDTLVVADTQKIATYHLPDFKKEHDSSYKFPDTTTAGGILVVGDSY